MSTSSRESVVMVKELPPKRGSEHGHHRSRRKKVAREAHDAKCGERRGIGSSASEKVIHASDVTMPFFWRWATDTSNGIKKKPAQVVKPTTTQRESSYTSASGRHGEYKRRSEEISPRSHRESKATTVTRDLRDRPSATRSLSHPVPPSTTARPSLRRSKTAIKAELSNPNSPSVTRPKRPDRVHSSYRKSKQSAKPLEVFSKPKKPVKMAQCVSCMDDVPAKKGVLLPYCKHTWCTACVKNIFELSVKEIQHMPPTCCTKKPIQPNVVGHLFDSKWRIAWNRKYSEWSTKDRLYCSKEGCGMWIKPEQIKTDKQGNKIYGECKCKYKVCPKCNGKYHPKSPKCTKDDQVDEFIKTAKENGWQQCPKCSITIERTEGCNHMKCPPPCKHEFCIVCAAEWKTCDCPWFPQDEVDRQARLAGMGEGGPAMQAAQNFTEEMAMRREQERQDEEFARRMQMMGMEDDGPPPMNPHQGNFMPHNMAGGGYGGGGQQRMNMPQLDRYGNLNDNLNSTQGLNMMQEHEYGGPQNVGQRSQQMNMPQHDPYGGHNGLHGNQYGGDDYHHVNYDAIPREGSQQLIETEERKLAEWDLEHYGLPEPRPYMPMRMDPDYEPPEDDFGEDYLRWDFHADNGAFYNLQYPYGPVGAPPQLERDFEQPPLAPFPPNSFRGQEGRY